MVVRLSVDISFLQSLPSQNPSLPLGKKRSVKHRTFLKLGNPTDVNDDGKEDLPSNGRLLEAWMESIVVIRPLKVLSFSLKGKKEQRLNDVVV